MARIQIEFAGDLVRETGVSFVDLSPEAARLLALDLCRRNRFSIVRAAEFCQTTAEEFRRYALAHNLPQNEGRIERDRYQPGAQEIFIVYRHDYREGQEARNLYDRLRPRLTDPERVDLPHIEQVWPAWLPCTG